MNFSDLQELVRENRNHRRFIEAFPIEDETPFELVNLTRFCASSGNLQPLRYLISCESGKNALIFPCLKWAGYYQEWANPSEGERPSAYIIVLNDLEASRELAYYDAGIAVQTILLGATLKGLRGCIIGAVQRQQLREILHIPERYEILLVLALGKPKGEVKLEATRAGGDTRYWYDETGVHHVPKRSLDEVVLKL